MPTAATFTAYSVPFSKFMIVYSVSADPVPMVNSKPPSAVTFTL